MNKISYLKGLLDGLQVHPESREGKMFYAVCEALEETASYAKKLEARVAELEELCDILDEDLGLVEEMVEDTACSCNSCDSKLMAYERPERFTLKETGGDASDDSENLENPENSENPDYAVEEQLKEIVEEVKEILSSEKISEISSNVPEEDLPETPDDEEDSDDDDTESFLEDGEEEYETTCPTCGECILLTEQMLEEGETICPTCGEELEFDFDEEEIERLAPAEDE
ncbi:MAG: hypothetical protein K2H29_10975 [Oscillospiraceae bacterium]|nr:hypothetical protein [Oscillospiraceae bacterium]